MSGIAAGYNLDGRPIAQRFLARMTDAIAHRGSGAAGHWINGCVGLGHQMAQTTPESLYERQPLTDESGQLCLILDGRVDNREELRSALSAQNARLRDDTDAELVLRAYQCWGTESPQRIVGDFAYVIWDGRERQLFCARDFLGVRPFFYHLTNRSFICGSELQQVLRNSEISRRPNEGMVAEYLAGAVTNKEETLFEGIFRLPPAHTLLVRPEGVSKNCYWKPTLDERIRYRTDEEYVEHFSSTLATVVKSQLRARGPVGAHLSGGLDSSIVVATANRLFRQGQVAECGFEAFSVVYPTGWPCDERQNTALFSETLGIKTNFISPGIPARSHYLEQARVFDDFPDQPNGCGQWSPMNEAAIEKGVRVMLTGQGGNEWFEGGALYLADLLRELRFGTLLREAKILGKIRQEPSLSRFLFRRSFLPLVPPRLRRFGKRLLGRKDFLPDHIAPALARRVDLPGRLRIPEPSLNFAGLAQKDLYLRATDGWPVHARETTERFAHRQGIEMRSPFYDRRLADLAFRLPVEQRYRHGEHRPMVRKALKTLLPEHRQHRDVQGDFSILFPKTFAALDVADAFRHLKIASLGWIEPTKVQQKLHQVTRLFEQGDQSYAGPMWSVWAVYGIELWYEQVFNS